MKPLLQMREDCRLARLSAAVNVIGALCEGEIVCRS